jgi:hypothetical protein
MNAVPVPESRHAFWTMVILALPFVYLLTAPWIAAGTWKLGCRGPVAMQRLDFYLEPYHWLWCNTPDDFIMKKYAHWCYKTSHMAS